MPCISKFSLSDCQNLRASAVAIDERGDFRLLVRHAALADSDGIQDAVSAAKEPH